MQEKYEKIRIYRTLQPCRILPEQSSTATNPRASHNHPRNHPRNHRNTNDWWEARCPTTQPNQKPWLVKARGSQESWKKPNLKNKTNSPPQKTTETTSGTKNNQEELAKPLGCLKITWNQTIVTTFLITHIAGPQKLDASKRLHESTVALTSVSHTKIMHQHRKRLQGIAFRLKAWHAHHQPKSKCWCWQHARLPGCLEGSKR